ncbi:MAG: hypothetical protein KAU21_05040 [Gammaproteobacteria bacterium]|nr:hypothetical protein [Gammaproteobacteria bacterium]
MSMINNNLEFETQKPALRDVTSTAKLFNFNRPVYVSNKVWRDCVDIHSIGNELAFLQRLRHVLFMASSALRNRISDVEYEFRIQRIPSDKPNERAESVILKLKAFIDDDDNPIVTISFPDE